MNDLTLLIKLAEKMALLAAAALVAVLFPPLRNRLLGVGRRRDKAAAVVLGIALSIWGAMLGFQVGGEYINVRAIGVFVGAILGGRKAGFLAGLGGGLFYAARVDEEAARWALLASVVDGVLAGLVAHKRPQFFYGWRAFVSTAAIQLIHILVVGLGLMWVGHASRYLPAWPAHLVKIVVNSAGITLFVVVARLVVSREEGAKALAEARAAAHEASLQALRRKLEPHFLFNALNALRATIRKDPERARELVSDLADLYRYLLSHPEDAPLHKEVEHACAYLAIERARLGDEKLEWQTFMEPASETIKVPALLLQPLVENAVQHGVVAHKGQGKVMISARVEDGYLTVVVEDQSEGALQPTRKGTGTALRTLRERLLQRFGEKASLDLLQTPTGARAVVSLPMVVESAVASGAIRKPVESFA